jgi:hypothetical protein
MDYLTLENILLILIIIFVIYNFNKCHNNKSLSMLEKFDKEMILSQNITTGIFGEKLNNIKLEEKVDILFSLYVNFLKIIQHPIFNDKILNESIDLFYKNIDIIINNDKIKNNINDKTLRDIFGHELYERNKNLYKNVKKILDKKNETNIIDMKNNISIENKK